MIEGIEMAIFLVAHTLSSIEQFSVSQIIEFSG